MSHALTELADVGKLQELADELYALTGVPSAIIALDGELLTQSGWQRICTEFHRRNPLMACECLASDTVQRAAAAVTADDTPPVMYRCPHGLVDAAAPVVVDGEHVANVFVGQLLTRPMDDATEAFFRGQASQFGLDAADYLAALRDVPVIPEARVRAALLFFAKLVRQTAQIGLAHLHAREVVHALEHSEEMLNAAERIAGVGSWAWHIATNRLEWSAEMYEIFGVARAGFTGELADVIRDAIHPEDRARVEASNRMVAEQGRAVPLQYRVVRPDGTVRVVWAEAGELRRDKHGAPVELRGMVQDITERVASADALRASEARLRAIIENQPECLKLIDRDGRLLTMNPAGLTMLQATAADVLGKRAVELVAEEHRAAFEDMVGAVFRGETRQLEFDAFGLRGRRLTLETTSVPLEDPAVPGRVTALLGLTRDVTVSRRAAADREQALSLLRATLESTADGILVVDLEGRIESINERFIRMWNLPADIVESGDDSKAIIHVTSQLSDPAMFLATVEELYSHPEAQSSDLLHFRDGRCFERFSTPQLLDGRPVGRVWSFRDVTERRRAEEALRAGEERFRALTESTSDAIIIAEREGRIAVWNRAAEDLFQYSAEEAIGQSVSMLMPADVMPAHRAAIARIHATGTSRERRRRYETEALRKDGTRVPIEISMATWFTPDNALAAGAIVRDITARRREEAERRRLHDQLVEAQRREAVGRLAGGVAHDFNNQLSVILGNTEIALQQLGGDDAITAELTEVRDAALRSAALTRQLLAFARKQVIAPKVIDLNDAIASVLKMIGRLINEEVRLEWRPAGGLRPVYADAAQIDQVMANLAVNAGDAMRAAGGVLDISTANVTVDETFVARVPDAKPGAYVRVRVHDTGCGMTDETLARVFEPFFTTKPMGQGTGLGMSMVHGIVHQHNGFIDIQSAVGDGTTVDVYFPAAAESLVLTTPEAPAASPQGRGEVVLVVEDETSVRGLVEQVLRRLGYTVHSASDGAAALAFDTIFDGTIDLVISDVVMPGMSGKELVAELRKRDPLRKYLFMSGYADATLAERGVLPEGVHFIQKPFEISTLAKKVRSLMDETRGARDGRLVAAHNEAS